MLSLQRNFSLQTRRLNEVYVAGEKTSIFHIASSKKRKTNTSIQEMKIDQLVTNDTDEIQNHVTRYFETLYGANNTTRDVDFAPDRRIPDNNQSNRTLTRARQLSK